MDKLNLFELVAKITLDTSEYEEEIEDSKKKSSTFFDVLKANLTSQAIIGGFQKISSAVTNFGKAALDGYAEYEQLAGGITTLFEDLNWDIEQNAANAYKSAGLSANEYMSTVMSFAASLNQSLLESEGNISRSADLADQAVIDMADNANKMGTSMEMIQNAYAGFAKGNFTMLDNLKLGYGGTKQEMERLLADAEKLSGVKYDISSFASITEAIHVVQDEMGIAGATAAEAATTIEGSVNSMKAAWGNLVTGIGNDNADLELLVGNFIDSAVTAAENVIPRIGIILQGIGKAVLTAAPQAIQAGNDLIATLTDGVVAGVPDMLARLPAMVEGFAGFVTDNLPVVLGKGVDMLNSFVDGVLSGIPDMLSRIPAVIDAFVTFVADNGPVILLAGADIIANLIGGIIGAIPDMVVQLPKIITSFVETLKKNWPKIIASGFDILMRLGDGVFDALPDLVVRLPEIGKAILDAIEAALSGIFDIGANIVSGLWNGISSMGGWIKEKVSGFFSGIVDGAKETLGIQSPSKVFASIGGYMAEGLGQGWENEYGHIKSQIESGLNFGTGTVDFGSSGIGATSAGIINSLSASASGGAGPMTFNLMLPDGTVLARYQLPALIDVAKANGTPILNPT